ncbi:MAG TPA: hypothetical protein VFA61_12835 [Candidatus Udaeobacter sp.]|nr:hypothetical protein [Candidatus Udaeobacter sp.]
MQMVLRNRIIELAPEITFEHTLARPRSPEYGPDLGFIEMAACELLGSIKAIASIWPLDGDPKKLLKEFGTAGSSLASVGIPEERCQTEITGNEFRRVCHHLTCLHVIENGNIAQRNGWDYIDSKCWYGDSNPWVTSFKGVVAEGFGG